LSKLLTRDQARRIAADVAKTAKKAPSVVSASKTSRRRGGLGGGLMGASRAAIAHAIAGCTAKCDVTSLRRRSLSKLI
jgi:hypothetical protein